MAKKPRIYASDDYAGLDAGGLKFYFGYEVTSNDEWCFHTKINGKDIVIPESKLDTGRGACGPEVVDKLLVGIGWILTGYDLVENTDGE